MEILKDLVAINSVSGNELRIQKYIVEQLQILELKPCCIEGNVMVKIDGINKTKAIIFNAHVDTVAVGDKRSWIFPPLQGTVVGNKMYGLGTSDEKATVAALLLLAKNLVVSQPSCDVWITFVVKEESDGSGTKAVMDWFKTYHKGTYESVAGVLGEPTGLLEIETAHKGNIFLEIITKGHSGHGSNPKKIKQHAVLKMYEVINKLMKLQDEWNYKYKNDLLGSPTIGIATSIIAGDKKSPNKFPDSCTATFDIRTIPLMHNKAVKEIKQTVFPAIVNFVYPPVSYGYTDKTEKIVEITKKVTKAKVVSSTWSNDLCFFTHVGIPAVVIGPGEREVIHKANEFCYIEKIDSCIDLYTRIILEFTRG